MTPQIQPRRGPRGRMLTPEDIALATGYLSGKLSGFDVCRMRGLTQRQNVLTWCGMVLARAYRAGLIQIREVQ